MRDTIREGWTSYLAEVVPKGATPVQVEECRRAFYGGAAAMFRIVAIEIPSLPDEDGVRLLDGVFHELKAAAKPPITPHNYRGH